MCACFDSTFRNYSSTRVNNTKYGICAAHIHAYYIWFVHCLICLLLLLFYRNVFVHVFATY